MNKVQLKLWFTLKAGIKAVLPTYYGTWYRNVPSIRARDLKNPKRILLLNGAHIGDIVITTSLLPILRAAYPNAEIGYVVGSWAQMVVKNHPEVAFTHCVDHWRHNRSSDSLPSKFLRFRKSWRKALGEIRDLKYDVAICLYTVFPDFLDLAWKAEIPVRIGFSRSIMSFLATDVVHDPENPFPSQGERLAMTLEPLGIASAHMALRRSSLAPSNPTAIEEVRRLLAVPDLATARYRIIHMGTGAQRREFPISFWRDLAEKLSSEITLLFTGQGKREQENIRQVIRDLPNCVDAAGKLSWEGFVAAVRHADVLYGVESMAGHVAGAVGTKCVVAYGGTAGVSRWRPEGPSSIVVTNHVPCAPCHNAQGCDEMYCMRGIRSEDLIELSH